MIKNQKQAFRVRKEIGDLSAALAEVDSISSVQKLDLKGKLQYDVWKGRLEDLSQELSEYEYLTSTDLVNLEIGTNNLQKAIISFRIASGLTQKDIADKLEIQEQQIQRYEQNDYLTASFERIIQILNVLEVEVRLKREFNRKTKVIDLNRFLIPDRNKKVVEESIQIVSNRKQLVNW